MSKNAAANRPSKLPLWLAAIWLLFVTSMVVWWWLLGLSELKSTMPADFEDKYRMIFWEGIIFLAAIVGGGFAFLYFIYKDDERHQQLRNFFSIFTHDIKTSIARLRLQADLLREQDEKSTLTSDGRKLLQRLVSDINRLDLQLENALFISQNPRDILVDEKFLLGQVLDRIRPEWEELEVKLEKQALIAADHRAFTSCLRNLIQNSVIHGNATQVVIQTKNLKPGQLEIVIEDNGKGYSGDYASLGSAVLPSNERGGNGIGLYLSKKILEKMKGQIVFEKGNSGFRTKLIVQGDTV